MKNIVVAIDGSEGATRALRLACEMTRDANGRLWIVNVICNFGVAIEELQEFRHAEAGNLGDLLESLSAQWLNQAEAVARQYQLREIRTLSRSGDTVEAIVAAAGEMSAALIVVGRRGRGLVSGLMMGSVSLKLASAAPRPVLIVP